MKRLAIITFFIFWSVAAHAVEPNEMLDDPVLEQRARNISKQLSCPVCAGETIDESNSKIAQSLRIIVREQLQEGATDDEVLNYVAARYGEKILLRTPFNPRTYLLWFGPLLLLAMGSTLVMIVLIVNRRKKLLSTSNELTPEEQVEIDRLIQATDARE